MLTVETYPIDLRSGSVSEDSFYLTGYEGIFVKANRHKVAKAVLSTVVPMCGEVAIVCPRSLFVTYYEMCFSLRIDVKFFDIEMSDCVVSLSKELKENKHISHVLCLDVNNLDMLMMVGQLVQRERRQLIVEARGNEDLNMSYVKVCNIDYLIDQVKVNSAVVIARRSKLVKTEGNARIKDLDIYDIWQNSLINRKSSMMPM